jgi:hypothetical protein
VGFNNRIAPISVVRSRRSAWVRDWRGEFAGQSGFHLVRHIVLTAMRQIHWRLKYIVCIAESLAEFQGWWSGCPDGGIPKSASSLSNIESIKFVLSADNDGDLDQVLKIVETLPQM